MDDARIRQLTEEVLSQISGTGGAPAAAGLESRVAALEAAVARLQSGAAGAAAPSPARPAGAVHPSLHVLRAAPSAPSDRCVLEPDKPCVQSGQCRSFGH